MARVKRDIDVIDVNRPWSVWVGSRRGTAYRIGTIRHATRHLALRAAREQAPGTRIGFVEEDY